MAWLGWSCWGDCAMGELMGSRKQNRSPLIRGDTISELWEPADVMPGLDYASRAREGDVLGRGTQRAPVWWPPPLPTWSQVHIGAGRFTRMFPRAIDDQPAAYLERIGEVFARFGADTQDSGNISYGVEVDGQRFFIKTAGDPTDTVPYLDADGRGRLLRNAARLAEMVHHPLLPAFHGLIESPGGPVLAYEWRDGALLGAPRGQRDDPTSAFQRFRSLPDDEVLIAIDDLFDLHGRLDAAGWVPGDFYDGSLLYDFDQRQLTVIDLDSYRSGPYRNDMGRMFGSSRFMAPEEFTLGAPIDSRTTAYVMARTVLVFLADGTLNRDAFRAPEGLYDVVLEAVTTRFDSFCSFHRTWLAASGDASGAETQIGVTEHYA